MSSLEKVNNNLIRIDENTEETRVAVESLDRNFEKWFAEQRRSRLDAEEDRREAKKAMAAMGAAGRAGNRGQQQGGAGPGVLPSIAAAFGALPPLLRMGLGITAGSALYKTGRVAYRTATLAPLREGSERLGQRTVDAIQRRRDARDQIAAAEKAEADRLRREQLINEQMAKEQQDRIDAAEAREQARIQRNATALTDVEYKADQAAAQAKTRRELTSQYLRGVNSSAEAYQAFLDTQIQAANNQATARTMRALAETPTLPTPTADTAPVRPSVVSEAPKIQPLSQAISPIKAADLIPNLELASRSRPLIDLVPDELKPALNQLQADKKIKYTVTPDGRVAAFTSDGKFLTAPALDDALKSISTLAPKMAIEPPKTTTPEKPVSTSKGSRVAVPGAVAALGPFGAALELGDIGAATFERTGATSVFGREVTGGALGVAAAGEILRLPGDLVDMVALASGYDTPGLGQSIADKFWESQFGKRMREQGGVVDFEGVGGQTAIGTAESLQKAGQTAVESVIAGIQVLGGKTLQDFKDEATVELQSEIERAKQSVDLINEIQNDLQRYRQEQYNLPGEIAIAVSPLVEAAVAAAQAAASGGAAMPSGGKMYTQMGPTYHARAKRLDKMMDGIAYSSDRSFLE